MDVLEPLAILNWEEKNKYVLGHRHYASAIRAQLCHTAQHAGHRERNLRSNYESTYGLCTRRIRGSASSVQCCRTVTVTLYSKLSQQHEWCRSTRPGALACREHVHRPPQFGTFTLLCRLAHSASITDF